MKTKTMKMKIVECVSLESSCNAQLVQSYLFHMHKFYLLKDYLFTKQTVFHFVFLSKKCLKKITPNCANQKNSLLFVDFVN